MSRLARAAIAALLLFAACNREVRPEPAAVPPVEATLFFTSELKGYLGPCGCSENMRGGIDRAAFQLEQARKTGGPVFLIDTGNALFAERSILPDAIGQQERKARALAQAFSLMGLRATVSGPLDDARGAKFRTALELPTFESGTQHPIDVQGHRVVVVSAPQADALVTLAAQARAARASVVIGLFEGPFDEALKLSFREGLELDLVIATRGKDELSTEENKLVMGRVPVVQVQSKGRSLLRLDLTLRDAQKVQWLKSPSETQRELEALALRIEQLRAQVNDPSTGTELRALRRAKLEEIITRREALASESVPVPKTGNAAALRFLPLETSFERLPAATAIVTAYDRDVGELNLAWAKEHGAECPAPAPGGPSYVGTELCRACHAPAFAIWQASKHARAHDALVEKGKNNHLDCVACHVTAWKVPGGICRLDAVEGKTSVGCEMCHGPGSAHVSLPVKTTIVRPSSAATCVGCHDRENSPHFDFEKYLPVILGPGHGQPLPAPPPVPDAAAPTSPRKKKEGTSPGVKRPDRGFAL